MLNTALLVLQVILSIALSALILVQAKGSGLSAPFGGRLGSYSTKRGVEKVVFNATVFIAAAFFISSLALLILG
jgi:preprotein translocase subunit SecG